MQVEGRSSLSRVVSPPGGSLSSPDLAPPQFCPHRCVSCSEPTVFNILSHCLSLNDCILLPLFQQMTGSPAQRSQCALPVSGSTTTAIVSTALSSGVGLLLYAETPRSQKRLLRSPSSRFRQCINRVSCSNDQCLFKWSSCFLKVLRRLLTGELLMVALLKCLVSCFTSWAEGHISVRERK